MSSTLSISVSNELGNAQHGATQLGANQAMPIDYRFRGDISDKSRWHEWKRNVFAAVRQIGVDVKVLTEELEPDAYIYPDNNVANRRKRSKKAEELRTQEQKVFGAVSKLIEPNSRAASVIGDSFFETSNIQGLWQSLIDHFEGNTFSGLYDLYEQLFQTPSEVDDVVFWVQRCYNLLAGTDRFERPAAAVLAAGAPCPHQLTEATKTAMAFAAIMAVPRFRSLIVDFMREEVMDLDRFDIPFATFYKKLTIYVSSRESKVPPSNVTPTATAMIAENDGKSKLSKERAEGDKDSGEKGKKKWKFQKKKNFKVNKKFGKFQKKNGNNNGNNIGNGNRSRRFYDKRRDPNRDYDQRDSYEQDDYDRSRNSDKRQVHSANHTERRLDEMTPRGCFTTIFCGLGQGESISNDKLLDTGATATMLNQASKWLLNAVEPCDGDVIGAGGVIVGSIIAKGTMTYLGRDIEVYYAPKLPKSVISISQLTRGHGLVFTFTSDSCIVKTANGVKVSETTVKDGLYIVEDKLFAPI
jgi:predicted aspartyl protease